jgi:hypothetical protein
MGHARRHLAFSRGQTVVVKILLLITLSALATPNADAPLTCSLAPATVKLGQRAELLLENHTDRSLKLGFDRPVVIDGLSWLALPGEGILNRGETRASWGSLVALRPGSYSWRSLKMSLDGQSFACSVTLVVMPHFAADKPEPPEEDILPQPVTELIWWPFVAAGLSATGLLLVVARMTKRRQTKTAVDNPENLRAALMAIWSKAQSPQCDLKRAGHDFYALSRRLLAFELAIEHPQPSAATIRRRLSDLPEEGIVKAATHNVASLADWIATAELLVYGKAPVERAKVHDWMKSFFALCDANSWQD